MKEEATKAEAYTYRPLNASESEVRILALETSADDKALVKCKLLHGPLDKATSISSIGHSPELRALKSFTVS